MTYSQLSDIENQMHIMIDIQELDSSYKGPLTSKTNREILFKTLKNELSKIAITANLSGDSVDLNSIFMIKKESNRYFLLF